MVEHLVERVGGEDLQREARTTLQRWEYFAGHISFRKDIETSAGKKEKGWGVKLPDGKVVFLTPFLDEMGRNGWEMVTAVVSWGATGGVNNWDLPHWLYFKRPKIDNQQKQENKI